MAVRLQAQLLWRDGLRVDLNSSFVGDGSEEQALRTGQLGPTRLLLGSALCNTDGHGIMCGNVPMVWSRTCSANLPLAMGVEAQLLTLPAPDDRCASSHASGASDPGPPSPTATPLHSLASEERASSAPPLRSAALSTPAGPPGRYSQFGHSCAKPSKGHVWDHRDQSPDGFRNRQ